MVRQLCDFLAIALIASVLSDAAIAGQVGGKVVCPGTNICIVENLKVTGESIDGRTGTSSSQRR
jgi:hypothetical protein